MSMTGRQLAFMDGARMGPLEIRPETATDAIRVDGAAGAGPAAGLSRTFVIVDGQALVRHGVALTLMLQHPGCVPLEVASATEAERLLETLPGVDALLLDLDGLGDERDEVVARLVSRMKGAPLLALSADERPAAVQAALRAGARGYVPKSAPSAMLEHSLALLLSGETYLPVPRSAFGGRRPAEPAVSGGDPAGCLTDRQQDIFRLILAGCSNKEIARELGVLEGTVKVHVRAVMQKLGAKNRTQVAVVAARSGLTAG